MPSRTGESASGDQLGRGMVVGKSWDSLSAGAGFSLGRGRTCLSAEGAGLEKPIGKGRAKRRTFSVKAGPSLKKLARRPCLLGQETAGDTGSWGILGFSAVTIVLAGKGAAVPYGCGSRAEGLLPERHRSRLPGHVPV